MYVGHKQQLVMYAGPKQVLLFNIVICMLSKTSALIHNNLCGCLDVTWGTNNLPHFKEAE